MILSADIKAHRLKKKYTQKEVADQLNISRQSVSKWETGKSFPSIENLILLSEILDMPLDFVNQEKTNLTLPFDFGKPKNRLPFLLWFLFPMLLVFLGLVNKEVIFIVFSIVTVFVIYIMSPFDFQRYYNYFSINTDGLTVFSGKALPEFPLWTIIRGLFGKRKTTLLTFNEIKSIEIFLDTNGFEGFNNSVSFRPRQFYNMREAFYFIVKTYDKKEYYLSLDTIYFSQSDERKYFSDCIRYLKAKDVLITDKFKILNSLQQELDFIAEAYKVQSAKPNNYVIKSQLTSIAKK